MGWVIIAVANPQTNKRDVHSPQIVAEVETFEEARNTIKELVTNFYWCYGIMRKESKGDAETTV